VIDKIISADIIKKSMGVKSPHGFFEIEVRFLR